MAFQEGFPTGSAMYHAGLGNVGSYQVSGVPFVTGGLDAQTSGPIGVNFPQITQWVQVNNSGSINSTNGTVNFGADLRVGFSANGIVSSSNYIVIPPGGQLGPLKVKATQLHLSGGAAGAVSLMAGLAFIDASKINNNVLSPGDGTDGFLNWSGSSGVG